MRVMCISGKRGVSLMVSYVLLIAITISLSILVFNWLRFFAGAEDVPDCPEGVNLIIQEYNCTANPNGILNVTLKNKGRFTVENFVLRVNDRANAEFGIYTLRPVANGSVSPGKSNNFLYYLNQSSTIKPVRLIDVQPIVEEEGKQVFCKSFATQKATCP